MLRTCSKCGVPKPASEFRKSSRSAACKECYNKWQRARWAARPTTDLPKTSAAVRAYLADYYRKNKLRVSTYRQEWRGRNLETVRASSRKYRKKAYAANPERERQYAAERRARMVQAMPAWADTQKILAVYAEATRLTRSTGVPHHVDHIIPLKGKFVCGLHVHYNLQVLTATENLRKSNLVVEEMIAHSAAAKSAN